MGQGMIVTDPCGRFVRIASGKVLESLFEQGRTAAEQHELHVRREHFHQSPEQNVAAFLVHQTADAAEQRPVRRLGQTHRELKRKFLGVFAAKVAERKRIVQERIAGRFPFRVIHPVQDADQ